ncbi:MAG: hypothetical protein J5732_03475 [Bacteroidaceae bacterium]|nr:hypothetical protein [Bacteroidaceae bacterium]
MFILGVRRENIFSPNRVEGDRAIFETVGRCVTGSEDMLFKIDESEFALDGVRDETMIDAVFHMCRSDKALERLEKLEKRGVTVINTTRSVLNCRRSTQVRLLKGLDVSFAGSVVVNTDNRSEINWNKYPCWVKRGDSHSLEKDDVCFAVDKSSCMAALGDMSGRGITEAVLQEHVEGHILKFYGVGGDRMFYHAFYDMNVRGKFDDGIHNLTGPVRVDADRLRKDCSAVASLLDLDVYGGDAVVTSDGRAVIIDFNDWPSFGACREQAARAIAALIREKCGQNEQGGEKKGS